MSVEVDIPRYVDSQQQFYAWEFDEFVIGFFIFSLGILTRSSMGLFMAIGAAWLIMKLMRRWKEGEMEGAIMHIFFYSGFTGINKVFRDGLKRLLWL